MQIDRHMLLIANIGGDSSIKPGVTVVSSGLDGTCQSNGPSSKVKAVSRVWHVGVRTPSKGNHFRFNLLEERLRWPLGPQVCTRLGLNLIRYTVQVSLQCSMTFACALQTSERLQ